MSKRTEKDSMGELEVPMDALWAAQTQRAVNNFPISNIPMPYDMIKSIALIKLCAAKANYSLGILNNELADAITSAAEQIINNDYSKEFPVDIFQTGSGTSTNMNCNEVIANLAKKNSGLEVHPNDHINMSQSSNDVIPSAIHISSSLAVKNTLIPALEHLSKTLKEKGNSLKDITKTGRTHLTDALPITFKQELDTFAEQIDLGIDRVKSCLPRLHAIALGGTAVGTGVNTHPDFSKTITELLSKETGIEFSPANSLFEKISSQDTALELSGQLRVVATSMFKIANDMRMMNSGPLTGLAEINLPTVQPGSSIMPGKINPVIPESICQIAAQVTGNDATINFGASSGNFQLNVMLPVIAYNLLQSINIISSGAIVLADKAIKDFTVNKEHIEENLYKNPILVTALNRIIGYNEGAKIAKRAYEEKRSILKIALEMTDLSETELKEILSPYALTKTS